MAGRLGSNILRELRHRLPKQFKMAGPTAFLEAELKKEPVDPEKDLRLLEDYHTLLCAIRKQSVRAVCCCRGRAFTHKEEDVFVWAVMLLGVV